MKIRSPDDVRVLDSDGYKRRAACICLRDVICSRISDNNNNVINNSSNNMDQNNSSSNKNDNGLSSQVNQLYRHQQLPKKEILLISSSKNKDKWLVPGGGVDPGEDVDRAAVREALEEAGVKGRLDGLLGVFEKAVGTLTRTHVFRLDVEEEVTDGAWAESNVRSRKWFSLEEAKIALHKPQHKEYLERYELTQSKSGTMSMVTSPTMMVTSPTMMVSTPTMMTPWNQGLVNYKLEYAQEGDVIKIDAFQKNDVKDDHEKQQQQHSQQQINDVFLLRFSPSSPDSPPWNVDNESINLDLQQSQITAR